MLTFNLDGRERNCRKVNFTDYAAIRETIRRERLNMFGPHPSPEVAGIVATQPVTLAEQSERMMSFEGMALILFRCVKDVDETWTYADAERMALEEHPFMRRLYEESHLVNPTPPKSSEKSS